MYLFVKNFFYLAYINLQIISKLLCIIPVLQSKGRVVVMQEGTIQYKGLTQSNNRLSLNEQRGIIGKVLRNSTTLNLVGFLLGRAGVLGGLNPFGIAFYAALFGLKKNMLMLFFSTNIGILTIGMGAVQIKYVLSTALFSLLGIIGPIDSKKTINTALRVFLSVFVIGSIIVFYKGFLLYDFILNIFEAFIAFILVLVFKNAITIFTGETEDKYLSNEQLISVTILGVLIITGISNISILGLAIRNVLIICLIIIFALRNGPGVGAAIGTVSGLIISMSDNITPLIIGTYGFCGLIAGVFKELGKPGAILGFMLANSIITIYVNGSTEVLINLIDIVGAAFLIIFIPQKVIKYFNDYFIKPSLVHLEKKSKLEQIKDVTTYRLKDFASSFNQLANVFNKISEKNININKEEISSLFEEVAERVCRGCSLNTNCWNREFYSTYQTMFNMLEKMEQKGHINMSDIPMYFKEKCLRIEEFINNSNFMFELYKLNISWEKKISESRLLISQQLEAVSKVIKDLADEINGEIQFVSNYEREIYLELIRKDINVDEVMVIRNKYGKYEVSIAHQPCGNNRLCSVSVIPIVSKIVGRAMEKDDIMCLVKNDSELCIIKLVEKQKYKIITGSSSMSKRYNKVSGDNYNIFQLKDGRFVAALSDGMGSGIKANKESSTVLGLLEKFLQSGFDKDLSIKLINSILVLKSSQESFASVDISIINLSTAEVEFTKIGAVPTFIKRSNKVEIVKSTSLPVGILNNVDIEFSRKQLNDGDIIIMITDGILDSKKEIIKKEEWILDELRTLDSTNPQEIADYIIGKAKHNIGNEQMDDMTVLVAKVLEKVS